jgi:hypothetical protein
LTTTLPIENCPLEFVCIREWDWLRRTRRDDVRHCSQCQRDVHLCVDDAAIKAAAEAGHCIAIPIVDHPLNPLDPQRTSSIPMAMGMPWPMDVWK